MKKLLLLFMLFSILQAAAQHRNAAKIIGYVKNSDGKGLPDVTVYIKNTAYSTETDKDGHYILVVAPGTYEVTGSAIGYLAHKDTVTVSEGESKYAQLRLRTDPRTTLDQVVIEGKTAIQEVRETPFNVVALDAKSMYNSTLDLAHMLDRASGVKIRETGGVGSDMSITLNGFTGRHVRVFMDGVPMEGFGNAFQLNNIPVSVAERIEVYKGVVPIEFGTDALGGVINIVTNQSANTFLDASYSHGSFNTHRSNISLGHTFNSGMSLQIDAFQNYSDNNYRVKTETLEFIEGTTAAVMSADKHWVRRFHDSYRNETVIAKLGIVGKPWADRMLFGVTMGQMNRDIQNQADMRFVFGERTSFSKSVLPSFSYDKRNLIVNGLSVRVTGNYNYQRAGNVDTAAYRYNWFGERQERRSRGESGNSILSDFSNSNQSATANIGYRISEKHSIALNDVISAYTRRPVIEEIPIEDRTPADSMRRTSLKNTLGFSYRFTYNRKWNTNVFAKHYFNKAAGPYSETISGRTTTWEREEFASKTGYGIATTYFFSDIQVKASAEKAFRLPTDQELFGDEILETGNIALRPENSNNLNLGFTLNKEIRNGYTLYVDASGYYRNTMDFIRRTVQENVQTQAFTFGNTNHGRVTNLGTDLETRLYYKNTAMIGGTVTYMNIRDREPWMYAVAEGVPNPSYGTRMPNLPYFFGNVDVAYYVHDLFRKGNVLNLSYTFNFIDEIYLKSPNMGYLDSKDIIPKQRYSDFSVTYIMNDGRYNIAFEARNLENALLYDNFSLQKPGRNFTVKFRYYLIRRGQQ